MTPAETELFNAIEQLGRVEFDGAGREIGAAFLTRQLLRGNGTRPRKLTLVGVTVVGELDLEAGEAGFPVKFERCGFSHVPNFEQATLAGMYFLTCRLPGLRASQARFLDGLALRECTVNGYVQLTGAHVSGQLDMHGCVIDGPVDGALKADGLRVEEDVYCSGGFQVTGLTRMIGAHIGGQFICDGATFRNPGADKALELGGLTVDEHVFWGEGFSVEGDVNLSGADIAGRLICERARFSSPGRTALRAVGMTVRQEAEFSAGCTVDGEMNLVGSRFGGWLKLTGGEFSNPGGVAVNLTRSVTSLNLVLREETVVRGELRLTGARIDGLLGAQGARLENKGGIALDASGLQVAGNLSLSVREGMRFRARGQVVLNDAHVGGELDCTGGRFSSDRGEALIARGIDVVRDVKLCKGFVAHGKVDLAGASIEGKLDFTGAELVHHGDAVRCDRVKVGHSVIFEKVTATGCVRMCDARVGSELTFKKASLRGRKALKLKGTQVRGALRLKFAGLPAGPVDLRWVQAGSFGDCDTDWPDGSTLDGFVYDALRDKSMDLGKRLEWLGARHKYVPQVYLQLAATYARAGHHDQATTVLVAKEEAKRLASGRLYRTCLWILKPTVGYGYRPFRVLGWLGGLLVVGGMLFSLVGWFKPSRMGIEEGWHHPWLYTFDLLLPVVSLHHSDLWVPLGAARWLSLGFTVVGWILAICLVTGVGRIFKRDER